MMVLSPRNGFTTFHHGTTKIEEPLDCSVPILDLSIRVKPPPIPSKEPPAESKADHTANYIDVPTSTVNISSPGSQASSETSETSTSSDLYRDFHAKPTPSQIMPKVKVPRPFKAYPKNPLSLSVGVAAAECILRKSSVDAYSEFRNHMLAQVQESHGLTNKNMRRTAQSNLNNNRCDPSYWEKRRKNNEAAKRSRDARRAKEDEIAIRAAFLEQENIKLRFENAALRNETEKLKHLMYGRSIV